MTEDNNQSDALREIFKKVRRIEIATKRVVNDQMAGQYHSAFKGRGMEFAEVREYQYGDDVRNIDWNVTARFGAPFVKIFSEERELTVMLMVDASSSLDFGTVDKTKGEIAAEVCAILAFSAIKNNDRVGLIIFTDRIELAIPPKKGRRHVLRVIRELLAFKPEKKQTDLAMALEYLMRVQKKRAVVFMISDFMSPNYEDTLRIANRRHDLVAITLTDPREQAFKPVGLVELEDAETGEHMLIDTGDPMMMEQFAKLAKISAGQRTKVFRSMDSAPIDLVSDQSYDDVLVRAFRERARKARRG